MKKLFLLSTLFLTIKLGAQVTLTSSTNPTCAGMCNGTASFLVSSGVPPYSVVISGGCGGAASFTISTTTFSVSNLCGCTSPNPYIVTVRDLNNNPMGTVNDTVTKPSVLNSSLSIMSSPSCSTCCDGVLKMTTSGGTPSYQWSINGGAYGTNNTFNNLCAGTYTVCTKDSNGCTLCAPATLIAPSAIEENSSFNEISIYPNPTSDQFYIETNATDKLNVDLYDVNGRHVFSARVMDKSKINVTTLENGAYTLTIKTGERVINKKLIILR